MKNRRELTCAYLYTDGTLIEMYDEFRKDVKIGETCNVTLGYCKLTVAQYDEVSGDTWRAKLPVPHGRIVFHGARYENCGVLALAKGGSIQATLPSKLAGSPNSIERGLLVQYVELRTKSGLRLHWTDVDCISSQFTVQDTGAVRFRTFSETPLTPGARWGDTTIYSVRDLRPINHAEASSNAA